MARAFERAQRAEAWRVKAEEHKETVCGMTFALGSRRLTDAGAHFRKGEYREVIAEYGVAVNIYRHARKGYLQLTAAAVGTLTRVTPSYLDAETDGLQTRADFATVLEQNPGSSESNKALDELVLMREHDKEDEPIESEDCRPRFIVDSKVELESMSDSSDLNHEGNGVPCKSYNHDGCKRGSECKFSHAPDYKSVRDRLCVFSFDLSLA
ncbi:hypothetical protein EDB84DRAFT_1562290 [Lactarius hengduanensis]|nr:hypothetical protein EDB84DRAFT_1562290 [Lactarius hengduanensis]